MAIERVYSETGKMKKGLLMSALVLGVKASQIELQLTHISGNISMATQAMGRQKRKSEQIADLLALA